MLFRSNLTSANPIPVTATFSEPVTGFDLGDISVSGGSPANLNGSGAVYTFDVIPSVQEGPITISIAAGVAEDPAGRTNTAATPLSRSYDGSRPMGTILSDSDPLTSERRIPMRIEFSEEVTDFALSDLTIVNGRVENLGGASPVFTFDLIPEADGEVLVDLPENRVSDLAGNGNTASTRFTLTFDGTPPGVEIASSAPAVTNLVQIPVTVTFSEDVSGFDASDLVLGNATAEDFTGSNASYSFTLIPGGDGTVTVDIAAAAAEDAAGNPSTAALQFSRDFDGTGPGVTLTSAAPPVTNAPIPVTITFSKPVTGFGVEDLVVGNATPSGLSGTGAAYTVLLTPIADGPVTLDIAADAAFDSLGNGNSAALQLTRNFDAGQPSVTISSPSSPVSSDNPILVQVLFDKPVTGFEAADLVLGNARIRDFSGAGTQYDVVLIPEGDGAVTVDIPAGVAVDAAGNGNLAAPQFLRIYDGTPPIGTLATTATSPTLLNPIPVTVSFDEPVFGFDAGDLSVVNGSIANFAGSGTAYSFDLVPAADGEVTVRIQAGAAVNEAGLSNPASELLTVIFDGTLPGVTLATTVSLPTNLPVIPVTASFTEPVTGFDVTDLVIANGTAGNFAGQGAEYSFDLIPSGDGTVTVDIPAGAARDLTGNGNTPALQLALIHDATRPGVTLSGTPAPVGTPYPVTVTFSEPVTGLDLADFTVTGAALSNLAGSGRDYTLTVTASAAGHSLQLPEGVVQDAAGNGNLASNLFENAAPTDGPGLEITGLPESFSPGDRFTVTFTFSAPVRGFEPDDILVTNGTISALSGGPAVYAATLVPDGKGSLSVQVPLGAAEDANGMGSQAAMVSATLVVTREASKAINDFLQFRARSLVQNQAGLTGFVNGRGTGQITASTSGTGLTFDIHSGVKNETWFALSGSFTRAEDGGEMDYALVTIGTHRPIGRNAILGVMLQYDQSDMTTSGGIAVEGKGWLVGPYIAGQIQDQPIWYEGRLLYGRTDNRISPTGTFTDDFSGERWLAQFAVEGQFLMDRGVILYPSFTLSHVSETQFAYTDGLSGAVPGQRVALTEAAFGMDLEFPVRIARGELTLLAGISGILSSLQGDDTASAYFGEKSDSRGRLDLGLRYSNGAGLTASFAGFFDGIGSSFETTGLDAKVALEF